MNNKSLPGSKVLMLGGIALIVFGILLLISPAAVGGAVVKLVALVLMITGVAQLVQALRSGIGAGAIISALLGVLVAGLGIMVWTNPELGSGFLTALLMIFFIVHGLWKITTALRYRMLPGWLGLLFSGVLALVFVYLLWRQWPLSGAWAIGVLVGLDLLLTGVALVVLGLAARKFRSSNYVDTITF